MGEDIRGEWLGQLSYSRYDGVTMFRISIEHVGYGGVFSGRCLDVMNRNIYVGGSVWGAVQNKVLNMRKILFESYIYMLYSENTALSEAFAVKSPPAVVEYKGVIANQNTMHGTWQLPSAGEQITGVWSLRRMGRHSLVSEAGA